jgi:hypothetical protein
MALLEGLEAIDWSRYHHAYGPATDVPGLLRALANEDDAPPELKAAAKKQGKSVAAQVRWVLWGNVFHQGSVWGASAKVVPFVATLARAESLDVEVREFAVIYLHHLARGYPQGEWPHPFELEPLLAACASVEAAKLPQSVLDGDAYGELPPGTDADAASRVSVVWVRDCFLAVEKEVPRLLPLLDDLDLAPGAIALCASFPRVADQTTPALWKVAREETDSALGGMALVALAQLGAPGVSDAARVMCDAVDVRHAGAVYAAVADVLSAPRDTLSPASQQHLLQVPEKWREESCPFTGSLGALVDRMMLRLPRSAHGEVLKRLGAALAEARGFGKLGPMRNLLQLVELAGVASLDERQREVIGLIAEHGDWGQMINANQGSMLRDVGLPTEREALRALARPR